MLPLHHDPWEAVVAFASMTAWHKVLLPSGFDLTQVAGDGVEPSLSPYQNKVLPLHHPALFHGHANRQSGRSESNRLSRVPKTRGRPVPFNPKKLLTRVGFEPNLTSVKSWQPHQKSNGPELCAHNLYAPGLP